MHDFAYLALVTVLGVRLPLERRSSLLAKIVIYAFMYLNLRCPWDIQKQICTELPNGDRKELRE